MDMGESGEGQLIIGRKPVLELILAEPERVDAVFVRDGARSREQGEILDACRRTGTRFKLVPERELDRLYRGAHQGVIARLAGTTFMDLEELLEATRRAPLPVILALDQAQDPGNVGTLARTLYALGGGGLLLPKVGTAFLGGVAARASAGALAKLPVAREVNLARALDQCLEADFAVYCAAAGEGAVNLYQASVRLPAVIVIGGEEKGVRPNVAKRCETKLAIPMLREFDSLNLAQAGAILLGEFLRRQGGA